ncbi:hypothetical protein KIN20_029276, partial [Parelaphostrongylus tenuis]
TDLANQPQPEDRVNRNRETIIETTEEDPTLLAGNLADEFQCSDGWIQKRVKRCMQEMSKSNWIPHDTQAQKTRKSKLRKLIFFKSNVDHFLRFGVDSLELVESR